MRIKDLEPARRDEILARMAAAQKTFYSPEAVAARRAAAAPCSRCGGAGTINCYRHVEGGRCFRCGGSGKERS